MKTSSISLLLYFFSSCLLLLCIFVITMFAIREYLMSKIESNFSLDKNIFFFIIAQIPLLVLINFSSNILKWSFKKNQFIVISLLPSLIIVIILFSKY